MIKALVFDFDGLILETETPAYETWSDVYREHGHDLPRERWVLNIGASARAFDALDHLASLVKEPFDRDAVNARRRARNVELVAALETMAGVREYLRDARRLGLKVAVASSASAAYVSGHLDRLGLRDGIDVGGLPGPRRAREAFSGPVLAGRRRPRGRGRGGDRLRGLAERCGGGESGRAALRRGPDPITVSLGSPPEQ